MKFCPKCGKNKPKSEFFKNKSRSDGLSGWCKEDTKKDIEDRKQRDPEKYRDIRRNNYENHKDEKIAYTYEWRRANPEKHKEINARYRKNHPEKRSYWESERRARKLGKTSNFPVNGRSILLEFYGEKCMNPDCEYDISDENPITLDHVIPISWDDGTHSLDNIQVLCSRCNSSKGNREVVDYRKGKVCELASIAPSQ